MRRGGKRHVVCPEREVPIEVFPQPGRATRVEQASGFVELAPLEPCLSPLMADAVEFLFHQLPNQRQVHFASVRKQAAPMMNPLPHLRARNFRGRGIFHQIIKRHATKPAKPRFQILNSDANVAAMLALVTTVLEKPSCHTELIGNANVTLSELEFLHSQWERREKLVAARHPVVLSEKISGDAETTSLGLAERSARELLRGEGAKTWEDLSRRDGGTRRR